MPAMLCVLLHTYNIFSASTLGLQKNYQQICKIHLVHKLFCVEKNIQFISRDSFAERIMFVMIVPELSQQSNKSLTIASDLLLKFINFSFERRLKVTYINAYKNMNQI